MSGSSEAAIRIAVVIDQPSIRWVISASANRLTPEMSTVATANVAALKAWVASLKRRRRYSGTERTLAP